MQKTPKINKQIKIQTIQQLFWRYAVLTLMLFVQSSFGHEETHENQVDDYTISVVTETWFPFNYFDKNQEIAGTSTDLVKAILDHANIDYEINLYPWQRAFSYARTHKNTLIYSIFRTPLREDLLHWICPIAKRPVHSVYKLAKRKDIKIDAANDLANYTINLTRGTFPHEFFISKGMKEGVNLQLTATNDSNILMLLKNRVDLIVEAEMAIFQIVKEKGLPEDTVEKVYTFDEMNQAPICMALSKETPAYIVEKIRQSHKALYPH
ncbi:transporter substrate-binding domain-containing protein [Thalassotalea sp. SU-HH00458]|uniref:substrate-binding periplasmic protein n=1 Tax=Thalassotalea sp. SU-HH00458 TaxID=3127657 RepID=UPI003104A186